jgi:hypothetical protein
MSNRKDALIRGPYPPELKNLQQSKRKSGTPRHLLLEEVLCTAKYKKMIDNGTFISPISFWLDILNDVKESRAARFECARQLAKYMHRPQPTITEVINVPVDNASIQVDFVEAEILEVIPSTEENEEN